jgi:hypothetical protein
MLPRGEEITTPEYFTEDGYRLSEDSNEVKEFEASEERLNGRTWEQEREAIVKFLLILDSLPCSFNNPDLLPQIAEAIKRNDHWTGIAEESLKEYRKNQNDE